MQTQYSIELAERECFAPLQQRTFGIEYANVEDNDGTWTAEATVRDYPNAKVWIAYNEYITEYLVTCKIEGFHKSITSGKGRKSLYKFLDRELKKFLVRRNRDD